MMPSDIFHHLTDTALVSCSHLIWESWCSHPWTGPAILRRRRCRRERARRRQGRVSEPSIASSEDCELLPPSGPSYSPRRGSEAACLPDHLPSVAKPVPRGANVLSA